MSVENPESNPLASASLTAKQIGKMGFDEALALLEKIVDHLERDDVPLEQAITLFESGQRLQDHCAARLKDAQARLEKIIPSKDEPHQIQSVQQDDSTLRDDDLLL